MLNAGVGGQGSVGQGRRHARRLELNAYWKRSSGVVCWRHRRQVVLFVDREGSHMREGIRGFWILLEGHVALYVLRGMAAYVCEGLLALHRVRVGAHTHTSIQRREHGDRKRCH